MYSEGGFFKARLYFPPEFPLLPPKMKFITEMWHPNSASPPAPLVFSCKVLMSFSTSVYPDGNVCISILVSSYHGLCVGLRVTLFVSSTLPETISMATRTRASDGCRCTLSKPS